VARSAAEHYLSPLRAEGIDTLILGCTHYPLLKTMIRDVMGERVTIIDSAEETAKLVKRRLEVISMQCEGLDPEHQFFVSDIPAQFQEVGERFLGTKLDPVTRVELDALTADHIHEVTSCQIQKE